MTQHTAKQEVEETDCASDEAMREFLGYSLKRAYMVSHKNASEAIEPFGLKVRSFSALTLIVSNPGIPPSRLAEILQIERSNLVLIMDELETRELISRTRDPQDRRRFALNATLRGKRLQEKAAAASAARQEKIISRLTTAEYETLQALLRRFEEGSDS
ncbi:MarR family winged helix-turn-helix transcriptional regulator [Pseudooceanicola nanhaiensis]|uniref:MarR family winged helix-turn-helix transcriptional regulator n=1 Tax=Pseudooceanicola nanhaiensis TaxID=375761 RepID=UPI001CD53BB2|nr:MarR family transcriptional regulator [Pseudooceanicola nanhaiensis]MCA0922579.1 MarR family transcriptional regulator [Pseudooceanicola nanhaiensis]